MHKGLIGVQMSTVKSKVQKIGAYETLRQCALLGYRCVEISQIPMTAENVSEIKRAADDFDIRISSCTASLEPALPDSPGEYLSRDFDKIISDMSVLNCHILRIGMLPVNCMGSREEALAFVRKADMYAERLKPYGIDLYYHNHHVEFVKYDGEYLLDIIRNSTKYMGFELDLHWIQRGGENPVEVIKRCAGRIRLLHLKDYRVTGVKLPDGLFDPTVFMNAFTNIIEFAEVGEGNLPINACITAALEGGCEYFLVEQDDTYGRDPFESLKISRDNLIGMGYADWFKK